MLRDLFNQIATTSGLLSRADFITAYARHPLLREMSRRLFPDLTPQVVFNKGALGQRTVKLSRFQTLFEVRPLRCWFDVDEFRRALCWDSATRLTHVL